MVELSWVSQGSYIPSLQITGFPSLIYPKRHPTPLELAWISFGFLVAFVYVHPPHFKIWGSSHEQSSPT